MTQQNGDQALPESQNPPLVRPLDRADRAEVRAEIREGTDRSSGLERIREILLGDILVEVERRLARLDRYIANRANELQQDVRYRTGVLEAHVRKEVESVASRGAHDSSEISAVVRAQGKEHRDAVAKLEQRLAQIEDRLDGQIARVEREVREQVLAQAKSFIDELERVRNQLRASLVRELGLAPEPLEEGGEHAGAWPASH